MMTESLSFHFIHSYNKHFLIFLCCHSSLLCIFFFFFLLLLIKSYIVYLSFSFLFCDVIESIPGPSYCHCLSLSTFPDVSVQEETQRKCVCVWDGVQTKENLYLLFLNMCNFRKYGPSLIIYICTEKKKNRLKVCFECYA